MSHVRAAAFVALGALIAWPARGQLASEPASGPLAKVRFEQLLGESVPAEARFIDDNGVEVTFGDYLGDRPIVLSSSTTNARCSAR